ncbi:EKC/KEOPS complex subunit bud32-like isoform X2 [Daktulosphaira vitifoliae]|uniref:EKC/KEOPS complex subunit bud32-like isoform X2 n=1 Tax=Daktulosphaira vitifoliae TaxID=58002 RepID=UPI0021AACFD4|nr:EKC/KEOPS complex subunit bud32-like isoform X2 [Daktulosphaira vitifoliae]
MDIFKQGAESKIYCTTYLNKNAIIKERFPKKYRNKVLDQSIRKERTKAEAKAILKCKQSGICTPALYNIDIENCKIAMEDICGQTVNEYLTDFNQNKKDESKELLNLLIQVGKIIGKMHLNNIFHGDLTTSNILIKQDGALVLIDFGLSHFNPSVEDRAVDLYVLERAFISTHSNYTKLFSYILDGYKENYKSGFEAVFNQLQNVRARGRKRLMVG